MAHSPLRISTVAAEGPFQASKWLAVPALLDVNELESLLQILEGSLLYNTGSLTREGEEIISQKEWLEMYRGYIASLKEGKIPDDIDYRVAFSPVITASADHLYRVVMADGRQLVRIAKPVIQLQAHSFDYSSADGKFRSMVLGTETITWGLQFSYPQLFQDNATKEVFKVGETPQFPNTHLFHLLQQWIRRSTIPTPLIVDGKAVNVPIRIGKECLPWINRHPQLIKKGLKVGRIHGN